MIFGANVDHQGRRHADTAPADRDAWSPAYSNDACKCTKGLPADCRYPNPTSVEIDPRNGWAYLSSDVGLLSSPNGGRRWIRQRGAPTGNPADIVNKMVSLDNFTPDTAVLGAKLYTKQYHCAADETAPCNQPPVGANSLDRNAHPDRITFVGRMSLTFTPCSGNAAYTMSDRRRGHLVGTVPVEWLADAGVDSAGKQQYRRVSSVFMAAQRANCDATKPEPPPGALVFWDTAHLELIGAASVHPDLNQDYKLTARTKVYGMTSKLLQNLQSGTTATSAKTKPTTWCTPNRLDHREPS